MIQTNFNREKLIKRAKEIYTTFREKYNIEDSLAQTEINLHFESLVGDQYTLTAATVHDIVNEMYHHG